MFVPPDHRLPPLPPVEPSKRRLTPREESFVLGVVIFVLVLLFVAPIGGSTVLDAVAYLFGR